MQRCDSQPSARVPPFPTADATGTQGRSAMPPLLPGVTWAHPLALHCPHFAQLLMEPSFQHSALPLLAQSYRPGFEPFLEHFSL